MEKLTIEHVNPYLPFGLKIKTELGILELNQISTDIDWYFWCNTNGDYDNKDFNFDNLSKANCSGRGFKGDEIKPILRPLSDLTKEIEHNGERFIAGLKLVDPEKTEWDKMVCEEYNAFPKIPTHSKYIQVKHEVLGQIISINPKNIGHLPHNTFKKLYEWHFDLFGLIENNLAININDL